MNKKYELTNITMEYKGRTLYRIRALKNFANVKKGDLGGWVCNEYNLSQEGNCWIYDEAKCMEEARVTNDSKMYNYSEMYDYSELYNYSEMHDNSKMYDCAIMFDNSKMFDCAIMFDDSKMFGNSEIHDDSKMFGNSEIHDDSKMYGNARMYDNSAMYGDARMHCEEKLYGELISKVDKFIDISNPKGKIVTGVLKNGEILFNVGNLSEINKEEFLDILYNGNERTEELSYRKEYLKIIDMIELYLSK